jgi:uncharacterized protein (TIGR02596 family)
MKSMPLTSRRGGFTLIESLTVVGILALLVALVAPPLFNTVRASRMTAAGELVAGKMIEAQGLALAFSSDVELRIYKSPPNAAIEESSGQYLQILQLVEADPDSASEEDEVVTSRYVPVGGREPLPQGIAISSHQPFSSIWNLPAKTDESEEREYVAIRYRPDGSLDLAETESWYVTLVEHPSQDPASLSANFYTVQIDSVTGKLETFRPE